MTNVKRTSHSARSAVAAFRRAGKRAMEHRVGFHLSNPTCCSACAEYPTGTWNVAAGVYAVRYDGRMNPRSLFSTRCDSECDGYLYWDACDLDFENFHAVVADALRAEGFAVEVPADDLSALKVRYCPEASS